jgi:amino acid transporter
MILAAASITNPDYVPTNYQTFLLTVFIMLTHACISSMPTLWIANFNSYGSTLNIICLVVVVIMIPACVTGSDTSPKFLPSSQVWSIQNGTDWPDGIAVLMSFLAIIWTMSGYGVVLLYFEFDSRMLMYSQMLPSISQKNAAMPALPLHVR